MDGWYGRNTNRLWIKSEGKSNTAFKSGYDMNMQMLYVRLIAKYYDFQVGVRVENQTSKGGEETARAYFVIGFTSWLLIAMRSSLLYSLVEMEMYSHVSRHHESSC